MVGKIKAGIAISLFFFILKGNAQVLFNERIDIGHLQNSSTTFINVNDTFYLPTSVVESQPPHLRMSISLMQVKADGNVIQKKRFGRDSMSISGGDDIIYKGRQFYVVGTASWGNNGVYGGFYKFNNNCDTLLMNFTGDTSFYHTYSSIKLNKKNSNESLCFGSTDTTCGINHPGTYKTFMNRIDTSGNVLSEKLFFSLCKFRNLRYADTTEKDGYVFSGFEYINSGYGTNFIIKIDSNYNVIWINYYGTTTFLEQPVLCLKNYDYLLSTSSLDSMAGGSYWSKIQLIKIGNGGNTIWNKKYGTLEKNAFATRTKQLANKDLITCGVIDVSTGNILHPKQLHGFLLKTDSSGNEKWFNTYKATYPNDTIGQNYLYDVLPMSDDGFAAVGFVSPGDTSTQDTWLLRVDSFGCLMPGCNLTAENLLYEEGLTVYPNPSSSELVINLTKFENAYYYLYNDIGVLVKQGKIEGEQAKINIDCFPNGLYLLQVNFKQDKIVLKRIIVQH